MTYATYAALAAGTAAKYEAAQKTKQAQTAVQTMESERQKRLRGEAEAALNANIKGNEKMNVETEIADNTAKRTEALDQTLATNANEVGVGSKLDQLGVSAKNRLVQTDSDTKKAENVAAAKSLTQAMASMGGFGDMVQGRNVANARGLMEQGRIGNYMAGSNAAAGVEMDSAGHAGDNLSMLGDVLNTIAVVSGGYAAQGTSPFNTAAENAAIIQKNAAAAAAGKATTVTAAGAAAPTAALGTSLLNSLNKRGSGYIGPYSQPYYSGYNSGIAASTSKKSGFRA
jgi:hypothetical protein